MLELCLGTSGPGPRELPPGYIWRQVSPPVASGLKEIVFFKGQYYLFPSSGTSYYVSGDGVSWVTRVAPFGFNSSRYNRIMKSNHRLAYMPSGSRYMYHTTDGINWNTVHVAPFGDRTIHCTTYFENASQRNAIVAWEDNASVSTRYHGITAGHLLSTTANLSTDITKSTVASSYNNSYRLMSRNNTDTVIVNSSSSYRPNSFSYFKVSTNLASLPSGIITSTHMTNLYEIYQHKNFWLFGGDTGNIRRCTTAFSNAGTHNTGLSVINGFVDNDELVLAFGTNTNRVALSTDGGNSWNNIVTPPVPGQNMFGCFGNDRFFIGGSNHLLLSVRETPA